MFSLHIYNLISSYFSNRIVRITTNTTQISKVVSKGCPQGSVLGPLMWNIIFDDVLEEISNTGNEAIAYADDIAIIVKGNSRKALELKANEVTSILNSWCTKQKLVLSVTKSHMILLKGFLDIRRPPTVKIGSRSLRMVSESRYLGVTYGTRMNITPHINYIYNKSKTILSQFARVAKSTWGLNNSIMESLYKGVFIPIISYAAAGWADKLNTHHHRKLNQAQRYALIGVTKAYRTVSTDALCVIAGATPIGL